MAKIRPFKALRFTEKAGEISQLVCPPYDIIPEEQRKALISSNEHNVIRLELPKGDDPYNDAAATLKSWLADGVLAVDEKPGYYIYEEKFFALGKNYSLKGFITQTRLEDFSKGIVLPHEETLSKAKKDRYALMQATGCNFSQIYSLYKDDGTVKAFIDKLSDKAPDVTLTDGDGVTHNLWCIYDENDCNKLTELIKDKKLYIADGHHRYETALNFSKQNAKNPDDDNEAVNYCMMMLVDMENDGLVVFPTHRVLHSLENFDGDKMLERCREYFDIEKFGLDKMQTSLDKAAAEGKKAFAFYRGGESFDLLTLKDISVMKTVLENKSDAYRNLDVSVLHSLVLERLFGIDKENMANQINLFYTRSIDEAIDSVRDKKADCSFIINPTLVSEISDVAAAGEKMPQKSTYFYPKLITGLVMNKFDE